jgi:chromosome partitioning protein
MPAVKIIAVINQKGGVGKTTTTANLGAAIAAAGRRVCLMDLDPQCHLTLHFGLDGDSDHANIYDVFTGEAPFESILMPVADNLMLAGASIDLAGLESHLAGHAGREYRLARAIEASGLDFDYLIIDCPPSLGLLTLNALATADEAIIPMQPQFLALQGMARLLQTISLVHQRINPKLTVRGVVLCMFERITRLANEVVMELHRFFDASRETTTPWSNARVFETVVRRNIRLAESPSHGQSIFDYDARSHGAEDYHALAEEFLESEMVEEPSFAASPLPTKTPETADSVDPEAAPQPESNTELEHDPAS